MLLAAGGVVLPGIGACTQADGSYTIEQWRADRGQQFLVAHRGSGDVFPEHTLEAYEGALDWGAKAIEISVVMTSDGVLVCQHDLTFDRTTNLKGRVASQPSNVLINGRVNIGRLGPRWNGERAPKISRLDDVLRRLGKRCVIVIEAKDDSAFPGVLRLISERGLERSTMIKLHYATKRIPEARKAGLPMFVYIGAPDEFTEQRVKGVAALLDPRSDVLVVPAADDSGPLPDDKLKIATDTGVPVWVFPVHRRWEVDHFFQRGVQAVMASSYGYLSRVVQPLRATDWQSGAIAPGEMTRFPDADAYGFGWPEDGVIQLSAQRRQAFITLGQLAPLERSRGPYRVTLDIRVDVQPTDPKSNFTVCFAHADDRYYEHRQGTLDGYHAMLRMDGTLELRSHTAGSESGSELAKGADGPAPVVGTWLTLTLDVDERTISWSRADTGATVNTVNSEFRGDYMHIGRSATDGKISVRNVSVT